MTFSTKNVGPRNGSSHLPSIRLESRRRDRQDGKGGGETNEEQGKKRDDGWAV